MCVCVCVCLSLLHQQNHVKYDAFQHPWSLPTLRSPHKTTLVPVFSYFVTGCYERSGEVMPVGQVDGGRATPKAPKRSTERPSSPAPYSSSGGDAWRRLEKTYETSVVTIQYKPLSESKQVKPGSSTSAWAPSETGRKRENTYLIL